MGSLGIFSVNRHFHIWRITLRKCNRELTYLRSDAFIYKPKYDVVLLQPRMATFWCSESIPLIKRAILEPRTFSCFCWPQPHFYWFCLPVLSMICPLASDSACSIPQTMVTWAVTLPQVLQSSSSSSPVCAPLSQSLVSRDTCLETDSGGRLTPVQTLLLLCFPSFPCVYPEGWKRTAVNSNCGSTAY